MLVCPFTEGSLNWKKSMACLLISFMRLYSEPRLLPLPPCPIEVSCNSLLNSVLMLSFQDFDLA